jgi:hypothetical protein
MTTVANTTPGQVKEQLKDLTGRILAQFRADLANPVISPAVRADREAAIRLLESGCSVDDAKAWAALQPEQKALVAKLDAAASAGAEFTPTAARARLAAKRAGGR